MTNTISNIITNPWVTGIGGGIISSFIVYFVTLYLSKKRGNKEYFQKVKTANNEILYLIKPLVIDKKVPQKSIIEAIRVSIAKNYGIRKEDLYTDLALSNDLIIEILANSFLTSEQKIEFCELLETIKKDKHEEKLEVVYVENKKHISATLFSILLATLSFSIVLLTTLLSSSQSNSFSLPDEFRIILVATLLPILMTVLLYATLSMLKRRRNNLIKEREELKKQLDQAIEEQESLLKIKTKLDEELKRQEDIKESLEKKKERMQKKRYI